MEIRNISPNDLPVLMDLVGTDDFTDICYEYSKMSINEDGEITSFVITRKATIQDFYDGIIPSDESNEGVENYLIDHPIDKQYQILHLYLKDGEHYTTLENTYESIRCGDMIWMVYNTNNIIDHEFYNF